MRHRSLKEARRRAKLRETCPVTNAYVDGGGHWSITRRSPTANRNIFLANANRAGSVLSWTRITANRSISRAAC